MPTWERRDLQHTHFKAIYRVNLVAFDCHPGWLLTYLFFRVIDVAQNYPA
jgi:hypothetical protein